MFYFLDTVFSESRFTFQVLVNIFGVGPYEACRVCRFFGLKPYLLWVELSNKRKTLIWEFFSQEKRKLTGEKLKLQIKKKALFLTFLRNYRAIRKISGLPARGQRSKTNRKTSRKLNR